METLASVISHRTLEKITGHFGLDEVTGDDGGPFLPLVSPAFGNTPVGAFRLWHGGQRLQKVVYTGIAVEPIGIDSHMIFAFTKRDSIVPTFTLDSVYTKMPPGADPNFPEGGDMYAFHLDLVPRCDLGVNSEYMSRVYADLTDTQAKVLAAEGVFPALLSPTQRAIMSPWMLAQRTTADAYDKVVFDAAETYTDHWLALVGDGLESLAGNIHGEAGASRDAANRDLIFNRDYRPCVGEDRPDAGRGRIRPDDLRAAQSESRGESEATGLALPAGPVRHFHAAVDQHSPGEYDEIQCPEDDEGRGRPDLVEQDTATLRADQDSERACHAEETP